MVKKCLIIKETENFKRIREERLNFEGDLIVNNNELIIAYLHKSGNVEFYLKEDEFGEYECLLHKNNLEEIATLISEEDQRMKNSEKKTLKDMQKKIIEFQKDIEEMSIDIGNRCEDERERNENSDKIHRYDEEESCLESLDSSLCDISDEMDHIIDGCGYQLRMGRSKKINNIYELTTLVDDLYDKDSLEWSIYCKIRNGIVDLNGSLKEFIEKIQHQEIDKNGSLVSGLCRNDIDKVLKLFKETFKIKEEESNQGL